MALSRFVLTADVTIPWPATWSEIVNGPASGAVTTPAVPASTVAVNNPNGFAVQVVITGGTMTAVIVNGTTVGTGAGTYAVPAAGTISMTYTVAPTWAWSQAPGGPAGGHGQTTLVSATAPAGGQAGPIPQTKFLKNQVIFADSTGPPFDTGAKQLYQAIGAGNLRAFVHGSDDVGHAGLAN
jgi:hypothetical protein